MGEYGYAGISGFYLLFELPFNILLTINYPQTMGCIALL